MEFIQLKEVGKSFGKAKVLENVNLSINEGEIVGIIGQSGSGKTTLLNLIGGFLQPTAGEITYVSKADGQPKNLHKNFHKIKKH
ncbi:MAG: ATP-binding cassette domain-containing protein, partial [Nanoarchaeota archaeon]